MKKILAIFLCLIFVSSVVSCNHKNENTKPEKAQNTTQDSTHEPLKTDPQEKEESLDSDYKKAYLEFLKNKNGPYCSFSLVFIDNDDIPELYLRGISEAEGDIVCSFKNGAIIEQRLGRTGGGKYIERSGEMINQNGHMDRYYDVVYKLDDHGFSTVLDGRYEESYAHIGDEGYIITHREYFIDSTPVNEAEYNEALGFAFDLSKAVRLDENAVSYDAIVQKLLGNSDSLTSGK